MVFLEFAMVRLDVVTSVYDGFRHNVAPLSYDKPMSVSDSYRTYVLEQLGRVTQRIRSKSMFGGVGVYSGDHFFALVDNDTLFFKVDDATRGDFVAKRMKA